MAGVLDVKDLAVHFYTPAGVVKAVDGVSFSLHKGQTLGIVGESGSGKSVTMQALLGLIPCPPGRVMAGTAHYAGTDLLQLSGDKLRRIRGHKIAMIFQDPMTSLNPYLTITTQLCEVLEEHEGMRRRQAKVLAIEALEQVGIPQAAQRIDSYPHQFSGGMRQRVMIAMALIAKPEVVIADEPTTALDVTTQAEILDLLRTLQHKNGLSLVLISHDLGVVAGMSDDVMVMYAGRGVEQGSVEDIFYRPRHPYTSGLLRSLPRLDGQLGALTPIAGSPPDPAKLPPGCPFAPRCSEVMAKCRDEDQALPRRRLSGDHQYLCHLEG